MSALGGTVLDVISPATVSGGSTIISMADGATGNNVNWFTAK